MALEILMQNWPQEMSQEHWVQHLGSGLGTSGLGLDEVAFLASASSFARATQGLIAVNCQLAARTCRLSGKTCFSHTEVNHHYPSKPPLNALRVPQGLGRSAGQTTVQPRTVQSWMCKASKGVSESPNIALSLYLL